MRYTGDGKAVAKTFSGPDGSSSLSFPLKRFLSGKKKGFEPMTYWCLPCSQDRSIDFRSGSSSEPVALFAKPFW